MLGTFNNDQPKVVIKVQGASGEPREMEAIIDSGFNGYLQIPLTEAFPVGLALVGIQNNTIADSSGMTVLVCRGKVCISEKCIETTIDIHKSNVILIGTKLLKELEMTLILDCKNGKVELK